MEPQPATRVVTALALLALLLALPDNPQANAAPPSDIPFPGGPHILADPREDSVSAIDWPEFGVELTLTIEDCESGERLTEDMLATTQPADFDPSIPRADFDLGVFDLDVGQCLEVTGDGIARQLSTTDIHVLEVDTDREIITGIATPSASILVHFFPHPGTWRHVYADGEGNWSADFSRPEDGQPTADIRSGSEGGARSLDEERDGTHVRWIATSPFAVFKDANEVMGWNWGTDEWVVLQADDPSNGPGLDYSTESQVGTEEPAYLKFMINPSEWWLKPAQTIHLEYQGRGFEPIRSHRIIDLRIGQITPNSGLVEVASDTSGRVAVDVQEGDHTCQKDVTGNGDGSWLQVDFRDSDCSLSPGAWVLAKQFDEDGDHTVAEASVPNPTIDAWPAEDRVDGWDWPESVDGVHTQLFMEILRKPSADADPVVVCSGSAPVEATDDGTLASFDLGELSGSACEGGPEEDRLRAGDVVSLAAAGFTREIAVTNLAITGFDLADDGLSGTAGTTDNDGRVWVYEVEGAPDVADIVVPTGPDGSWGGSFSYYDLVPSTCVKAFQAFWSDGAVEGYTQVRWCVTDAILASCQDRGIPDWGSPRIDVISRHYAVYADNWDPATELTLMIDDPATSDAPDYTRHETTSNGKYWFTDTGLEIRPGFCAVVTDGRDYKALRVGEVRVGPLDIESTVVNGTATPGDEVHLVIFDRWENRIFVDTRAPVVDGQWSMDLRDYINDLSAIGEINAMLHDPSGDATVDKWTIHWSTVVVNEDHVVGTFWERGMDVRLSVDDPDTPQAEDFSDVQVPVIADWDPYFTFVEFDAAGQYDIKPGDIVTLWLVDTPTSRTLVVPEFTADLFSVVTDQVAGHAPPGYEIDVNVCNQNYCDDNATVSPDESAPLATRHVVVDEAGSWAVDFGAPGDEDYETEIYDIVPGTRIQAWVWGDPAALGEIILRHTAEMPEPVDLDVYLHGIGPHANPPTLFADGLPPTDTSPDYKDSPPVSFKTGNPWREVGVWNAAPGVLQGSLTSIEDVRLWLGLKNSDDMGTRFDIRAEAYRNGQLLASGETYCVQGVVRNPALAKEIFVPVETPAPVSFDGSSDVLALRVLARIGTDGAGAFCGGHSGAVGLRLYFDSVERSGQFLARLEQ